MIATLRFARGTLGGDTPVVSGYYGDLEASLVDVLPVFQHREDVNGQRLRDMGLVERKYCPGDAFDELTNKGRAAVEYTARTMGISLK